ncbi:MAG: hypothetical protein OXJ52_02945 [Oligoflexia bacterium]|nr:hypothetical protein [Oligoflexia bacterium]
MDIPSLRSLHPNPPIKKPTAHILTLPMGRVILRLSLNMRRSP